MSFKEDLQAIPTFESISDKTLTLLNQVCHAKKFQKYETVIDQNDSGKSMLLVYSGVQRIFRIDQEGKEVNIGIHSKGFLGEMAILGTNPARSAFVEAIEETKTYEIFKDDALNILDSEIDFLKTVTTHLVDKLFRDATVRDINELDLKQRTFEYLKLIKNNSDKDYIELTQEKMSAIVNATRPRVNEALSELEAENFISKKDNKIYIF